jgi:aminoglycoside phosphotransferase (APT) family kinase protein
MTWIHGDLLRPNLLVDDGRLVAVIDFGGFGIGDAATDLIPAWSVFGPAGRSTYRDALDVDEGTWRRGRGIALSQAAFVIPYYPKSNPRFVELSVQAIEQIIDDFRA